MAFGQPLPADASALMPQARNSASVGFVNVPQTGGPLASAMQAKPKLNWLGVLGDALAGAAGRPGTYAEMLAQQRQMQLEQQMYESRQNAELNRQVEMYDYERTHPNDPLTRYMSAGGIDPNSDAGKAMYQQAAQNTVAPFQALDVTQPDGSVQRQYVRPPTIPTAPVGNLTPLPSNGGPTQPASGSFPSPNSSKRKRGQGL